MINEEVFYDTRTVSLTDRESFNNTILLLTMVKSKYYYIIGFSRPEEKITVGFDFDSDTEGTYTKELNIDFQSSNERIIFSCDIVKTDVISAEKIEWILHMFEHVSVKNGVLQYVDNLEKNTVLPSSIRKMNQCLLSARREIEMVLQNLA